MFEDMVDDIVFDSIRGEKTILTGAMIDVMYNKLQAVGNNVKQMQKMFIVTSKEHGRVCFSSRGKWVHDLNEGDVIDIEVTPNLRGKDMILAKRPKLLKRY